VHAVAVPTMLVEEAENELRQVRLLESWPSWVEQLAMVAALSLREFCDVVSTCVDGFCWLLSQLRMPVIPSVGKVESVDPVYSTSPRQQWTFFCRLSLTYVAMTPQPRRNALHFCVTFFTLSPSAGITVFCQSDETVPYGICRPWHDHEWRQQRNRILFIYKHKHIHNHGEAGHSDIVRHSELAIQVTCLLMIEKLGHTWPRWVACILLGVLCRHCRVTRSD